MPHDIYPTFIILLKAARLQIPADFLENVLKSKIL
jgi:hypothetical protein